MLSPQPIAPVYWLGNTQGNTVWTGITRSQACGGLHEQCTLFYTFLTETYCDCSDNTQSLCSYTIESNKCHTHTHCRSSLVSCPDRFLSFVLGYGKKGSGGSPYVVLCKRERPDLQYPCTR